MTIWISTYFFEREGWIVISSLLMPFSQLLRRLLEATYLRDDRYVAWYYGMWLAYALGLLLPTTNFLLTRVESSKALLLLVASLAQVRCWPMQIYLLYRPRIVPTLDNDSNQIVFS